MSMLEEIGRLKEIHYSEIEARGGEQSMTEEEKKEVYKIAHAKWIEESDGGLDWLKNLRK